MRVLVATPCYDLKVKQIYKESLEATKEHAKGHGVDVSLIVLGNCPFIDVARDNLAQSCLDGDYTHLFYIDSDLGWEPESFAGIVTSPHPVSAGVYPQRRDEERFVFRSMGDPVDGWIPCDRMGAGFLCIKRDMLETLAEEADKYIYRDREIPNLFEIHKKGSFVGEDISFCKNYTKRHGPIWVWPNIDFNHDGRKGNLLRALHGNIRF